MICSSNSVKSGLMSISPAFRSVFRAVTVTSRVAALASRAVGSVSFPEANNATVMACSWVAASHSRISASRARGLARAELGDRGGDGEIEGALAAAPRNGPVLLYAARTEVLGGNKVAALELARRALNATDPAPPHQREAALALLGQNENSRH